MAGDAAPLKPAHAADERGGRSAGVRTESAKGIVFMLLSCALLTLHDAGTKWLTADYPVGQIMFIRSAVAVLLIGAVASRSGGAKALRVRDFKGQLIRAALFMLSSFLIVISLKLMALPIVTAVIFVAPIFVTALAGPLLGEQVGWRRWSAVLLGFIGVFLIVDPLGETWRWTALIPLAAALATGLRDIVTRQITGRESTLSVLFMMALVTAVAGLFTMPLGWAWPSLPDLALFVALGLAQGAAHYLQIDAFRMAEATVLAPFRYSMLIWSVLLGFLIWGDTLSLGASVGVAIVGGSGLYIFHREIAGRVGRNASQ
jgi:drug/metabolite transporter (DMT)-like permease